MSILFVLGLVFCPNKLVCVNKQKDDMIIVVLNIFSWMQVALKLHKGSVKNYRQRTRLGDVAVFENRQAGTEAG